MSEDLTKYKRRMWLVDLDKLIDRKKISNFFSGKHINNSVTSTIWSVIDELFNERDFDVLEDMIPFVQRLHEMYDDELFEYFEKRMEEYKNRQSSEYKYIFHKLHPGDTIQNNWRGNSDSFNYFYDLVNKYGSWVDVDWDVIKEKLDKTENVILNISNIGDLGNELNYNLFIEKIRR